MTAPTATTEIHLTREQARLIRLALIQVNEKLEAHRPGDDMFMVHASCLLSEIVEDVIAALGSLRERMTAVGSWSPARFAPFRTDGGALMLTDSQSRTLRNVLGLACQAAAFAAENAAAAERADAAGLPALTGTEKQVAWAATLREKALPDIDAALQRAEQKFVEMVEPQRSAMQHEIELIRIGCRLLRERTAASEWIDTRGTAVPHLLSRMRPALEAERAWLARRNAALFAKSDFSKAWARNEQDADFYAPHGTQQETPA